MIAAPVQTNAAKAQAAPEMTLETFLDRLMMAESGGRINARNPRSTAVGPYQFIASTWLQIARKSFASETSELKPHEILELRTDLSFARRAAKIYTEENAAYLVAQGAVATFGNLRLAFLVGPGGAARVLKAKPDAPVTELLGPTVIGANPFMSRLTAADLIGRASRDVASGSETAALIPDAGAVAAASGRKKKARPRIDVQCSLSLPSCRRWLALAERKTRGRRASRD
jgi:hypothetical protein